jgi:hypothetical protein
MQIGVIVDPALRIIADLKSNVVVDAMMAGEIWGRGSTKPLVIGVDPSFSALHIVHVVVESKHGAQPRTGHLQRSGGILHRHSGSVGRVQPGEGVPFASRGRGTRCKIDRRRGNDGGYGPLVDATPVSAVMDGIVRGLTREIQVRADEKIGP